MVQINGAAFVPCDIAAPVGVVALKVNHKPPSAVSGETCTMLTTTPNALMAPIHDRMPVVLLREDWDQWLDPDVPGTDVRKLLRPAPDDFLKTWPVLDMVEDPEQNGGYREGVPEKWR